ncbi:S10 family peptidase [Brevundimonas diminuta]|uniref:S10 family peptidase n=1 Tax=Brevundimonas diminuta TaxID=293 RepID=UPI0037CA71D5
MPIRTILIAAAVAAVMPATAVAQTTGDPARSAEAAASAVRPAVTTRHSGVFNGRRLRYSASVETLAVRTDEGRRGAEIVSYAYTSDEAASPERPVVFLFNGGPISPSVYLHMGLGPRRVAFPDDLNAPTSTYRLVDNPHAPLDAADLVFVDPASTGFSRVAPGVEPEAFFSVREDAAQFTAFIREWLRLHGREGSPVYILGESYGTNRAAEIARQFAESDRPETLAGVFLYGQAVNVVEYAQRPANLTSYVASLPTIAATAYYHGKAEPRGRSFEQFMEEAAVFAKGPYLSALYKGSDITAAEKADVARDLQAFSGLSADWYLRHDLKISKEDYRLELFRDEGLLLGRSDTRYRAPLTDQGGRPDPSDVVPAAMISHFGVYLRDELKVTWPEPYVTQSPVKGLGAWTWGEGDVAGPFGDWPYYVGLQKMMARNPDFRLVIGNGYYDTLTTVGAAEMLATQYGLDPARTRLRFYDGGHMGYSIDAVVVALSDDIRRLVGAR